MPNRLANETSPYLLQHKDNPVDWYPWGREALDKARAEDKSLLVSIGYSACHWCHVMEHESFEDPDTAALLNERFVAIKVDREERPDIDAIYMTALQAMGQQGGWPLNVFITHNGSPFYGGTYWPPDDRPGMPSFTKVLEAVADAYQTRRADVIESAEQLRELIRRSTQSMPRATDLTVETLEQAVEKLSRQFDGEHGGFGSAPKFPQPSILEFLLRRHRASGDERAARMAKATLDAMAAGGIYDQVGGGFHRYSVDAVWLVPHFEKMLYDNAQLARVYLDAFRLFGEQRYRRVVEETLDYVLREMTSPEGGFYATQDADSEGEEGKFYVWSPDEIDAVLGPEEGAIIRAWYGVTRAGNFEGHTILNIAASEIDVSKSAKITPGRLREVIDTARPKLLAARNQRVAPGRDEKIIVSWNGMMLRAFAEASRTLGRDDYRAAAVRNAEFLLSNLLVGGRLWHTYKDGQAKIDGFLDDYANLIDGLIALYEATFDGRWKDAALKLTRTVIAEFADPKGVGFFDTPEHGEELIARPRDLGDGATPAGNSVMASALLRLARMTGERDFESRAMGILEAVAAPMADAPSGYGRMLAGAEWFLGTPREIAIAGEAGNPETEALANAVYRRFEPFAVLGLADGANDQMPFLADRPKRDGKTTAYLCERYACLPPVHDADALTEQLARGTGISWQAF